MRRIAIAVLIVLACAESAAGAQPDSSHVYGRKVAEIRLIGIKRTKPYIVERELSITVGEPFTKKKEQDDYEDLDRLGIFSDIKIYGSLREDGGLVVFIDVKETFSYLPFPAVSISDENGISVGGGLKSVNLGGRAQYFAGSALFGGETTVELNLLNPWITGNHLGYFLEYYYRNRDNVIHGFYETANEASMTLRSYLGDKGRIGARVDYQGIRSDTEGKTLSEDNVDHVVMIRAGVGYDSRDLATNPSNGWWSNVNLGKSGLFGTDSDFWQIDLDMRRFQRLAHNHTLGLFSLYTGRTGRVGVDMAPWQLFGLGGSNTIRGYDVGTAVGRNQWISTVEYRWNFVEPRSFTVVGITASLGLQLALFTDFGSAWDAESEFRPNFLVGGGAGLRLLVPYVGIIRFDVGIGKNDPSVFLHISTKEKSERQLDRVR